MTPDATVRHSAFGTGRQHPLRGLSPDAEPAEQPPADEEPRMRNGRKSRRGRVMTVEFDSAEDRDRVQAAWENAAVGKDARSENRWIVTLLLRAAQDLEDRYNGGRPFTS
jgi:hypothetical protein